MPTVSQPVVLQIIPALNAGGAERTTVEMAQALTQAGWRALVAAQGGALEGPLREAGATLIPMRFAKTPVSVWENARALRRIVAAEGVNIVHARSRIPAWCAVLARRRADFAFITTYHGAHRAGSALKRAYNGVMARGDLVIANSRFIADRITAQHGTDPARIRVIPRGVDLARFDPDAMSAARVAAMRAVFGLRDGDSRPVLLLPARLTFWKGHETALQALALAPPEAAVLVFAGEGGAADSLRASAAALGVADRMFMPGRIDDMAAAYAASAVTLTPSTLPEAFGRTAAEAQAMRIPVIATAHGGALEVVADGETGLLTPPADASALASAIRQLLSLSVEARARMGEAGRARIEALYTTRALQQATMSAYRELLGVE